MHIVLALGLAQPLDEGFIHRAGGLGVGFHRLQLDPRHVLAARRAFGAAQARLKRRQMRFGGHHVIGGTGRQAVDFLGDLEVQVALLFLDRLHLGMQGPVAAGEIAFLRQKRGFLAAQLHDQGRRHDLGDIGGIARCHQLVDAVVYRLFLGQVGAGLHDAALIPTICWSRMELPGLASLRLCSAL